MKVTAERTNLWKSHVPVLNLPIFYAFVMEAIISLVSMLIFVLAIRNGQEPHANY